MRRHQSVEEPGRPELFDTLSHSTRPDVMRAATSPVVGAGANGATGP